MYTLFSKTATILEEMVIESQKTPVTKDSALVAAEANAFHLGPELQLSNALDLEIIPNHHLHIGGRGGEEREQQ